MALKRFRFVFDCIGVVWTRNSRLSLSYLSIPVEHYSGIHTATESVHTTSSTLSTLTVELRMQKWRPNDIHRALRPVLASSASPRLEIAEPGPRRNIILYHSYFTIVTPI
jgi:hypothetical protein